MTALAWVRREVELELARLRAALALSERTFSTNKVKGQNHE